jgi:MFS superfamily sulfate permease-like transporter
MKKIHEVPADGLKGLRQNFLADLNAGFLVFLIALPLSLGISQASSFPAVAGVFTAIVGGLVVSLVSGGKITIKGPAAGLISIALASVMELGYEKTLAVVVISGVLQALFGLLRLGRFADFFPPAVVHGMMAAIGFMILSKQIHYVLGVAPHSKAPIELLKEIPESLQKLNPQTTIIGVLSLIILIALPFMKSKSIRKIPASLLLLVLVAFPLSFYFELDTAHQYTFMGGTYFIDPSKDLVDLPTDLTSAITRPDFSAVTSFASIKYIIMFALIVSIESLLTVKAVDFLDPYKRESNTDKDLLAVGLGNIICGFIGALPMISEVVRSSANVNAGAKTRWSNFFHGLFLLLFVVFAANLVHHIPIAALAAILVYTGFRLTSPKEFKHVYETGWEQLLIFTTTMITTLLTNLLAGVFVGLLFKSSLQLLLGVKWSHIFGLKYNIIEQGDKTRIEILSEVLFTNVLKLKKLLYNLPQGKNIELDFQKSEFIDHSSMEKIRQFERNYSAKGGNVDIEGLFSHVAFSAHPLATHKIFPNHVILEKVLNERQKSLKKYADHIGAGYKPDNAFDLYKYDGFLFGKRLVYRSNRIIYQENKELPKLIIAEINLVEGAQPTSKRYSTTTLLVNNILKSIPEFELRKEDQLDRLKQYIGIDDIDFGDYPVFSSKYLLKGNEEDKIRELFTPELIRFLEENDNYIIESKHQDLLIYTEKQSVMTVSEVSQLFSFGKDFLNIITKKQIQPDTLEEIKKEQE